ncbi:hypothetical protein C8F01DRAFT_1376800 [Mycena amicta]|nr:hypothetical protein C8F01DRAFT_1376800 [Mycena amicta]
MPFQRHTGSDESFQANTRKSKKEAQKAGRKASARYYDQRKPKILEGLRQKREKLATARRDARQTADASASGADDVDKPAASFLQLEEAEMNTALALASLAQLSFSSIKDDLPRSPLPELRERSPSAHGDRLLSVSIDLEARIQSQFSCSSVPSAAHHLEIEVRDYGSFIRPPAENFSELPAGITPLSDDQQRDVEATGQITLSHVQSAQLEVYHLNLEPSPSTAFDAQLWHTNVDNHFTFLSNHRLEMVLAWRTGVEAVLPWERTPGVRRFRPVFNDTRQWYQRDPRMMSPYPRFMSPPTLFRASNVLE